MLKEGLISVGSRREVEDDPLDPDIIKRFDNRFQYRIVDDDYYRDSEVEDADHYGRILRYRTVTCEYATQNMLNRWYRDFFGDSVDGASILLPVGALRALRRLTSFASDSLCPGGGHVVLSAPSRWPCICALRRQREQ